MWGSYNGRYPDSCSNIEHRRADFGSRQEQRERGRTGKPSACPDPRGRRVAGGIAMTTRGLDRRTVLKSAVAAAAAMAAPSVHAARTLRLGYVSPQTGPLAAFAEADNFVISGFLDQVKGGLKIGSETHAVEVIVKDSQSNPSRAA